MGELPEVATDDKPSEEEPTWIPLWEADLIALALTLRPFVWPPGMGREKTHRETIFESAEHSTLSRGNFR